MGKIRRRLERELLCANRTIILVFALTAVILGALFALGGVNRFVYGCLLFPRWALPPFFMVLLWGLMLFLLGVSAALVYSSSSCLRPTVRNIVLLLFFASLVLCYVWIPLVYKAASFFLALLVLAVLLFCLAAMFLNVWRTHKTAAFGIVLFALWILYILYYTFALFLLN